MVNRPGFLRHHARMLPNFEIGSEKFYRDMLDPTYEKIKEKLKAKLAQDDPEYVAISLDGWSAYHHGYLGINVQYLHNWKLNTFNLACSPFDESHTAENIYKKLSGLLEEWQLKERVVLALRDNAANITAAFNFPGCTINSAGCLNHSLQLVVKKELFSLKNVESLIAKCRRLVGHANMSVVFYSELYKQEEKQMQITTHLGLKGDVITRWNSTYYMLERILALKPALAATLLELSNVGIEFSGQEWVLMDKVVRTLRSFEEATKILSSNESSISCAIPIVTTIIKSLSTSSVDHGVMGMKRALKNAMDDRFQAIETKEEFAIATILDPRYKHHFFRDPAKFHLAKAAIIAKIVDDLKGESGLENSQENRGDESDVCDSFESMMKNIIDASRAATRTSEDDAVRESAVSLLEKYLHMPVEENSFAFWKSWSATCDPVQKKLTSLACAFLTPPSTSTDVERLFSTAGNILTDARNRLRPENAEKLLFCRENFAHID